MSVAEERESVTDFAVDEGAIPAQGWQPLDVGRLPSFPAGEPGVISTGAAWSAQPAVNTPAALVFSLPAETRAPMPGGRSLLETGPALAQVPGSAFVSIGRTSGQATTTLAVPLRRVGSRGANDNYAAPGGSTKTMWRDIFFLAVLVATVAVAFLSGRVHGYQKVIVVPGPSSFYSVVT